MEMSKINSMSDDEAKSVLHAFGINCDDFDRALVIKALRSCPDDVNVNCMEYVDQCEVGMIVAFRDDNFNVKSAKVVKKSTSEKKLLLQTAYGRQFLINFSDVVWVKTTGRWPRWVFNLLKGISDDGSELDG